MRATPGDRVEVALRPCTDEDLPALFAVYASTRQEELAVVAWSDEQKAAFLAQQFWAQHQWWQEHYATAQFQVIEVDGRVVGRLYVLQTPEEIRIVDIALLPEWRGLGIGAQLLHALITEADRLGVPTTIHVEKNNPARRLYFRLGFEIVADRGVYDFCSRPPGTAASLESLAADE